MPITLLPNYLEYRINNKIVRYDIVKSRHSPPTHLMLIHRILEKPPSYISCYTVDRFRRKAPNVVKGWALRASY
uniref:Uncharacterized protein n=1 Tax=viral metagenome TaxID=1070528 RepID=A0A6C0K8G1_9ZZZZ